MDAYDDVLDQIGHYRGQLHIRRRQLLVVRTLTQESCRIQTETHERLVGVYQAYPEVIFLQVVHWALIALGGSFFVVSLEAAGACLTVPCVDGDMASLYKITTGSSFQVCILASSAVGTALPNNCPECICIFSWTGLAPSAALAEWFFKLPHGAHTPNREITTNTNTNCRPP